MEDSQNKDSLGIISNEEDLIENKKAEIPIEDNEEVIEKRKEEIANFFKKSQIWVFVLLIAILILGIYIRTLPMQDHGGRPGLWDITKNTWTLGPDLDPWLFTRYAKDIVEQGSLPKIDIMRNVPLGFEPSSETRLLPYLIAWTYYLINLFSKQNLEFAAVLMPVIMFVLTVIPFFMFVREIFLEKSKKEKTKANIIALISSAFMVVIPAFLSRTVAGIPEKESAAFFFMFLAFYLMIKTWKTENFKISLIFAILAGVSTALMSLIWGGVIYVFITIAISTFTAFILNKVDLKEVLAYIVWFFTSCGIFIIFSTRLSIIALLTSLDSGLAFLVAIILFIHIVIWKTKISQIKYIKNSKIPKNLISLIISVVLIFVLISVFLGPEFIIAKLKDINHIFFTPFTGRWNITVAENRQPYFTEWASSFGPFIKNIAIFFWLFFIGSVVLFKKMLNKIKKKDAWILTGLYILFFFGLVFSRYSPSSIFNGENFISKAFYYCSALLLVGFFVYYYLKYEKRGEKGFEEISYEYLLLFVLFALCLFTARGAVRLIMTLAPIAPIFVGALIVESFSKLKETKDETLRVIIGAIFIIILALSLFTFWSYYQSIKAEAYSFVPSAYNYQWQKAMAWVREETPKNAVFAHWWDYGYWVQSIGERATILDGGNVIAYWNYLMGRLVLTGDNQKDALEFLYNHNGTHLLIDSTDIGKYTAFSSIGSNIDYDRYSWIGAFVQNEKQTQETKNQTLYVYTGGIALDEDLLIKQEGKEIFLPKQAAGIGAVVLPMIKGEKNGSSFGQPYIIAVYQNSQYKVNLRYLYLDGKILDFKEGIEGCAYIFPSIDPKGQGVVANPIGAAMFISPRLFRGLLSQIYIMDDPLNKFPNFKLVHTESNLFIESLRSQGMSLPEFVYYQGIQGPIKIWEVEYTGTEEIKKEYQDTDYRNYIGWEL